VLFDQRVEDLLTVGEEAVERGRGNAGAPGDGSRGDGVDAALFDEGGRGAEDPLDGLAAADLDRLPAAAGLGRVGPAGGSAGSVLLATATIDETITRFVRFRTSPRLTTVPAAACRASSLPGPGFGGWPRPTRSTARKRCAGWR
jgi:hypothetical protein